MKSFSRGIFYTFGRIFAFIIFAILILLLGHFLNIDFESILLSENDNVYAANNGWAINNNLENMGAWSQSSRNNNNSQIFNSTVYSVGNSSVSILFQFQNAMLGRYISVGVPKMNNNYAYLVNVYFCGATDTTLPSVNNVYFGSDIYSTELLESNLTTRSMSSYPFSDNTPFGECRVYSVKTEISGGSRRFITFEFAKKPPTLFMMGYNFYPLGLAHSSISGLQSAINSTAGAISSGNQQVINNANSNKNLIIANQNANTQQQISNQNQNTDRIIENNNSNTQKQIDNMNDDNEVEIKTQGNDFFDMFGDQSYSLSDIITLPLRYINNMSSSECTPLQFTLPFVHNQVTLPCMMPIYRNHFPTFLQIWQVITTGIISYWVIVNLFAMFKRFKDPNDDKVEVMDL